MYTKLNASRSYVYAVARACDQGRISRKVRTALEHMRLILRANNCTNTQGLCWSDFVFY
jgi:hypothetical protein